MPLKACLKLLQVCRLSTVDADNIEQRIWGRVFVGTAEAIPPSELVDTTGAGDGFIGGVMYGKYHQFSSFLVYSTLTLKLAVYCGLLCSLLICSGFSLSISHSNIDNMGWIMMEQLG